jgi:plastocyanin
MNRNLMFGGIIVLVLVGGIGYVAMKQNGSGMNTVSQEENQPVGTSVTSVSNTPQDTIPPAGSSSLTGVSATDGMVTNGEVKTFQVEGSSFTFVPAEIRVKKGDTVKVVFKNTEGFHDWVLDEFSVRTKQIPAGQTDTVQFLADKTGTFEYYCSVGKHRQQGMVGKLIVE